MVTTIEGRGQREITSGELNKYGDPQNGTQVRLWGMLTTEDEKIKASAMSAGKGDVLSFAVRTSQRADDQFRVSCFGDLATQAGQLLKRGMRLTVDGRLRRRENTSGGRTNVFVDIVAWEIGMWDSEYKEHWIQYDASAQRSAEFVQPEETPA